MKTHAHYTVQDAVATITLATDVEGKPPALDHESLSELESCIQQAAADQPRLVIIRSAAQRFFCVGANINVLKETDADSIVPWVMLGHRVLNKLEDLAMPVIAEVSGYAMGGGLELAMACDLIFCADTAKLAQSEAGLGFIPGWGGTRRLVQRVGAAKAKYWFYSGAMIPASDAADAGLVDFVGSADELTEELSRFSASTIAQNSNAISQFKKIVNQGMHAERAENATVEAFASISCLQDADTKQRLEEFLNKSAQKRKS